MYIFERYLPSTFEDCLQFIRLYISISKAYRCNRTINDDVLPINETKFCSLISLYINTLAITELHSICIVMYKASHLCDASI